MVVVGNPSIPTTIALSVLALHATILSSPSCHIVAEDASSAMDNNSNNRQQQKQQHHLRRTNNNNGGSSRNELVEWTSLQPEYNEDDDDGIWEDDDTIWEEEEGQLISPSQQKKKKLDKLKNILESSGAAFLQQHQQQPMVTAMNHDQPLDRIEERSFVEMKKPTADDCHNRQWYPDLTSPTIACTNSLVNFPSSLSLSWGNGWSGGGGGGGGYIDDDPSIQYEAVVFDSSEACCSSLVDLMLLPLGDVNGNAAAAAAAAGECSVIDVCSSSSASMTTTMNKPASSSSTTITNQQRRLCGPLGWHPDTEHEEGCTNSNAYPQPWTEPGLKERMFHQTAKQCCEFFFNTDAGCSMRDACGGKPPAAPVPASGSSSSCEWHVDMVNQNGCSNDNNYPIEWSRPPARDMMFFSSAKACCDKMFKNKSCAHHNRGCDGSPPGTPKPTKPATPRPTKRPTRKPVTPRPTKRPTPNPTYRPTKRPTNRPTMQPTVTPLVYYVDDKSGTCVSNYETEQPHWIKKDFPIYDMCCGAPNVRDKKACLKARPASAGGIPFGTPHPTQAPEPVYYADPSSGMCFDAYDPEHPKPDWLKTTYQDYKRCCQLASRDKEACIELESAATTEESLIESYVPTPVPPTLFYLQDSTSMCVNQDEVPLPYATKATFEDYDECCKTGWAKEKCLDNRPTLIPTMEPSLSPSTSMPTDFAICPKAYDPSGATVYKKGSEVEAGQAVYQCKRPPHSVYCNQPKFRPPLDDPGPEPEVDETKPKKTLVKNNGIPQTSFIPIASTNVNSSPQQQDDGSQLWKEAWERLNVCLRMPTAAPTMAPSTGSPTCTTTRWHPGPVNRKVCTNNDEYPKLWNEEPFSTSYFADTAGECCDKFYPGQKCRIRDVC